MAKSVPSKESPQEQETGQWRSAPLDPTGQLVVPGSQQHIDQHRTANAKACKPIECTTCGQPWPKSSAASDGSVVKSTPPPRPLSPRALVLIIVNNQLLIPGVDVDIASLTKLYRDHNYVVLGCPDDVDVAEKRDLDASMMQGLIQRVTHQLHDGTKINGTPFKYVIVHLFAPGDGEYVRVPSGYERKMRVCNAFAREYAKRKMPVVVHIHSSQPLPPGATVPPTPADAIQLEETALVLNFFTHQGDVPGYDAATCGSWIVQQLIRHLATSDDVRQAHVRTNTAADDYGQPTQPIEENSSVKLKL